MVGGWPADFLNRSLRSSHDASARRRKRRCPMPSLFRFLTAVAVIGGLVYGGIFALATFFNPPPREITVTVPPDRFLKR